MQLMGYLRGSVRWQNEDDEKGCDTETDHALLPLFRVIFGPLDSGNIIR